MVLGAVRVLPGSVNLASKCDCSNAISFRDMTCFQNLKFRTQKWDVLWVLSEGADLASKFVCSNHLSF